MLNKKNSNRKQISRNPLQNRQTHTANLKHLKEGDDIAFTHHEEYVFEKYANNYNIDKNPIKEKTDNLDREKYVYFILNKKGLENTGIERLLNLTVEDIHHQYSVKNAVENKAGFVAALWGVLVATVLEKELYVALLDRVLEGNLGFFVRLFNFIAFAGLLTGGTISLFLIAQTLIAGDYSRYNFDNKEINFKCAVEDKNMLLTKLLDSNTNIWVKNEDANEKKYKKLKLSITWLAVFIFFIIISFSLQ